jgi:hypothetical protein
MKIITEAIYCAVYEHWTHGTAWDSEAPVHPPFSEFYEQPNENVIAETIHRHMQMKVLTAEELYKKVYNQESEAIDLKLLGIVLAIEKIEDCRTWCKQRKTTLV